MMKLKFPQFYYCLKQEKKMQTLDIKWGYNAASKLLRIGYG